MLPLTSRRRARRRTVNRRILTFGGALLVTVLVIGGLTQVSRNSGPYDAQMSRSFATQVSVLAFSSNATASSVHHLLAKLGSQSRLALQAELDAAVQQTSQVESRAATLAAPAPPGAAARNFATVFSDRAEAVLQLRGAIDGMLGMHPLSVAGSLKGSASTVSTPTLLSSTQATNRIAAAGALLSRSDRSYAAVRRALARTPGHARLPRSVWVTDVQMWQAGAVATQVDLAESSSTLAATTELALSSVRLSPPALPPPTGTSTAGVSILSPTDSVTVSVVLSNLGSVDEPRATVHISLTSSSSGRTSVLTRVVGVAASRSVTLASAHFVVKAGHSYQLSVSITLPPAQTVTTNTSVSQLLEIAPNSPPTTTTTTPAATTTTTVAATTTTAAK
jgi:hypothetical protein